MEFDIGYRAEEDPIEDASVPAEPLDDDRVKPELRGPIVDKMYVCEIGWLPVPVGPAEYVEFEVG